VRWRRASGDDPGMSNVPWRFVSLVAGLFFLALLLYWSMGASTPEPASVPAVTEEVAPPPASVRRDPRAATGYVQAETCRAACIDADRSCRAMALEESDQLAACAEASEACQQRCR
jgi:hypothetical protein